MTICDDTGLHHHLVPEARDTHGQVALMLCESLLHLLVEEGVVSRQKALEAIEGVAELVREKVESDTDPCYAGCTLEGVVAAIAHSFAAKD